MTVIVSFALFAINQTSQASTHQQQELAGVPTTTSSVPASATPAGQPSSPAAAKPKATIRTRIDEAANKITTPFSGVTSGLQGEWGNRGLNLVLTLIVYGFGLGFVARSLRVRL
jgi:hypothetical protein